MAPGVPVGGNLAAQIAAAGDAALEGDQGDIITLDGHFDKLPIHCVRAPRDRVRERTLADAVALATDDGESEKLLRDEIGFSTGTTNKLAQIHAFIRSHVDAAPVVDFAWFTSPIDEGEREARQRHTRERGWALFRLPRWIGSSDAADRLVAGRSVIHDGLFFGLPLVRYTGARRPAPDARRGVVQADG